MMWPMLRPHLNFIANLCSDSNLCTICGGLSLNPNQLRCIFKRCVLQWDKRCIQLSRWGVRWIFLFFSYARTLLFFSMINIPVFKIGITSSYPPTTYQNIKSILVCQSLTTFLQFLHVIHLVKHSHILETWYNL